MPKVHRALLAQSEELACRLRREGLRALNVSLKIRTGKFETITRSRSLQSATFLGLEIYSAAVHLFSQLPFPASGIRLIGVRVANLQSRMQAVQDPLDADQRSEAAARAIDSVREKYGMEALSLATLCNRDAKPELPSGESRG
ncbi:DinB/UmuC family translesion DNA polymerase [Arcanobacterium hippocoleae]